MKKQISQVVDIVRMNDRRHAFPPGAQVGACAESRDAIRDDGAFGSMPVAIALEVHVDGDIRAGQAVLKAIAMGAKGAQVGRAILDGLGALGQSGVAMALEIIRKELDLTLAFCGLTAVRSVGGGALLQPTA